MRVSYGGIFDSKRKTVRSQPIRLQVRELPSAGRPEFYRDGNVGNFTLEASVRDQMGQTPTTVPTGQRLVLAGDLGRPVVADDCHRGRQADVGPLHRPEDRRDLARPGRL